MKINTLTHKDAVWPKELNNITPKVEQLYIRGKIPKSPKIGVIGTRRPTAYGLHATEALVRPLAAAGACIVSGMAIGIDSAAHRQALAAGGSTIAVLPSSLQKPYPARHRGLAEQIANNGALITEYSSTSNIYKGNFIARNRIIAAMSDVLLVVEAAERSGTMHTVDFAIQLGKDVAAIPGPINHHYSMGTNRLLKDGVHLITEPEDLIQLIGVELKQSDKIVLDEETKRVFDEISRQAQNVDQLRLNLGENERNISIALTELELQNLVARRQDGMYARR